MTSRLRAWSKTLLEKHLSGETMHYRQIASIYIPVLIDQAFLVFFNLLNTALISTAGVAAISAVSMIDALNIFLIYVFMALATGGTVVVAQYKGSGNERMMAKAATGTVTLVAISALLISVLVIALHQPILHGIFGAAAPDVMEQSLTYLIGSAIWYPGIAVMQAVSSVLRGMGKTRAALNLSFIMHVPYALLNIILILQFDMGVLGLTIAANVARYLAAVCGVIYLVKLSGSLNIRFKDFLSWNAAMMRKIMYVGIPYAAEQIFFHGGKLLTQVFIVSLGTYAIAANAIASTVVLLYQIPANAMSMALVTVVGQCIGRKHIADARKFTKSFLWMASISFVLTAAILLPLFYPTVALFNPPEEILGDLFTVILINALAQIPLYGISFVLPYALRAGGDSKFTSVTAMLSMWLFRIGLGYLLGITFGMGIVGIWLAMNLEWGVRGIIFALRFRGDNWYRHKLIEDREKTAAASG